MRHARQTDLGLLYQASSPFGGFKAFGCSGKLLCCGFPAVEIMMRRKEVERMTIIHCDPCFLTCAVVGAGRQVGGGAGSHRLGCAPEGGDRAGDHRGADGRAGSGPGSRSRAQVHFLNGQTTAQLSKDQIEHKLAEACELEMHLPLMISRPG